MIKKLVCIPFIYLQNSDVYAYNASTPVNTQNPKSFDHYFKLIGSTGFR